MISVAAQDRNLESGKFCYSCGNYQDALKHFQKAAAEGYGEAYYYMGKIYHECEDLDMRNYPAAMDMYMNGLLCGFHLGESEIGDMYYSGLGVEKDYDKALEYYLKSNARGLSDANYMLANCYFYGHGTALDHKKAFELYKSLVNHDYLFSYDSVPVDPAYMLGLCYEYGFGCEKNIEMALLCYGKSHDLALIRGALLMDALEMRHTGDLPGAKHGNYGDKIDFLETAIKSWRTENEVAYFFSAYWTMMSITPDKRKIDETPYVDNKWRYDIFKRLTYAADRGYAPAQYALADCYENGWFTSVNLMKAAEWREAADYGNSWNDFMESLPYEIR